MKFIKQAKTGSASSGPLWFPLNTTSSLAVKDSIGATLDDGGGGIEGGGVGDVTPNAVNWANIASNDNTGEVGYSSVQITGINTNITLNVSSVTGGGLYYKISDSQVTGIISNLNTEGYTAIPSGGGNIGPVANNKWVTIANAMGNSMGHNTTVTVRNVTDSNAVLDTFVVTFIAGGIVDVTPSNSFDFGFYISGTGFFQSNYVTIAGINTPINLRVALQTTTPYNGFSRYVNYVETVIPSFPHTFTVSNGDVVYFEAQLITPGDVIYYNVYNDSDGGTLLTSMDGFQFGGGGTVSEE